MDIRENEGEEKFRSLLAQIDSCVNHKLYYVAIMASLAIPDIGGAISSHNGRADSGSYRK